MTRQEEKQKAAEDYIKSDAVGIGNEILAYGDFLNGADWADKTMIDKACELLARMIWEVTYEDLEDNSIQHYDKTEFIEVFRKAMEK